MNDGALLPKITDSDSSDTRWALETARTLWGQGERREALQWIRRAAESAAEAGQDDRALTLAKMGAELRAALEIPRTLPPPPAAAKVEEPPPAGSNEDELVVTVVSTDGSLPARDASLVAHRAIRVAVIAVDSPTELRVVRLAPGEVAPEHSTVALLVAFEPGVSPVRAAELTPRDGDGAGGDPLRVAGCRTRGGWMSYLVGEGGSTGPSARPPSRGSAYPYATPPPSKMQFASPIVWLGAAVRWPRRRRAARICFGGGRLDS